MFSSRLISGLFASALTWGIAQSFTNPIIWEDLPDNEVSRVGDTYYMTASTFHLSPGAPVLRSYDLVNWEAIGHSVPTLDWGPQYSMENGQTAYIGGIWASSLRYREAESRWYFLACVGFAKTYIYAASDAAGPWELHGEIDRCYYDAGLLFDDDGSVYVAYGQTEISVSQLSDDLKSEIENNVTFTTPESIGALEGARMYKREGKYYIFLTRPPDAQYMLKASSPWGPYEIDVLVDRISMPGVPGAGAPHQGSLVDTPNGDWYYMGFSDMYPGGRAPVLAPITWKEDGFPSVVTVDGAWGDYPDPLPQVEVPGTIGTDRFTGTTLSPRWEWNHNPQTDGFTVDDGLTLRTVTVTDDFYHARNTLTHRIRGPIGTGTLHIDVSGMADGDRAGLAAFRGNSGSIGVERDGERWSLVVSTTDLKEDWSAGDGRQVLVQNDAGARELYLRLTADIQPEGARSGVFSFSTDGETFTELSTIELNNVWVFFPGYRYAIYNYATKQLGGSVRVLDFTAA